jgi:large subunit ribosomal protein L31
MKEKIHPKYVAAKVVCACGHTFQTMSIKPELHVEVCSNCHPFFTGKQHLIDTQGRVDRFQKRYGKTAEKKAEQPAATSG